MQSMQEGQTIKHDVYGLGIVTASDQERTSVDFDDHGPKLFVTMPKGVQVLRLLDPRICQILWGSLMTLNRKPSGLSPSRPGLCARKNGSLAQVVEMHYSGGMTAEEAALVAGRSVHVVRHELRLAHAWMRRELAR